MLFNSFTFIVFLPIVFVGYWLLCYPRGGGKGSALQAVSSEPLCRHCQLYFLWLVGLAIFVAHRLYHIVGICFGRCFSKSAVSVAASQVGGSARPHCESGYLGCVQVL